jgi:hypothetical protein
VFAISTAGAVTFVAPMPTIKTSTAKPITLDNNDWAGFLTDGRGAS